MAELFMLYILTAVLYVICLVGFTVNIIIVSANFIKWKNLKSLQTCDQILSFLAISRGLYLISILVVNAIVQLFPWLQLNNIVVATFAVQTLFMLYSSQWIATILCVFYCAKIVNYKLLIFLKTRISTMVPWLIPTSLIISLLSSLPIGWYGYDLKLQSSLNGSTGNMIEYGGVVIPNSNNQFLILLLGTFPPFLIFCVANSLLIHFLLIHTRRMRSNESHIHSPNLKSHFGAMKSMSVFLLLQILLFIYMILISPGRLFKFKHTILVSWITQCSLQMLHSLYMISTSSDIRKMFTSMCLSLTRRS